ncbi:MAG: transglutaminase family protein, partial [Actinomycetales bacterium]
MRYLVSHRTTYSYDADVSDSLGVGYLTPRTLPWQTVDSTVVTIDPAPGDVRTDLDYYGNAVTYFQVTEPHQALDVLARSEVEVLEPWYDDELLAQPWEACRPSHSADPDAWRTIDFALGSSLVDHTAEAHHYAAVSLVPGRPVGPGRARRR